MMARVIEFIGICLLALVAWGWVVALTEWL